MAGDVESIDSLVERSAGRNKRKWTEDEDEKLVEALMELVNTGNFKADNGFKPGYLTFLENSLKTKLPGAGIKGKPHIESRMKTLKKDFSAVYDIRYGPNSSGFGCNSEDNVVTAPRDVWVQYLKAFDQQQQELVDAASKALSFRQDIVEENIRLAYALQEAEQERSTFVSSLFPVISEYISKPPVDEAQSIVGNLKIIFKHLQEQLIITEIMKYITYVICGNEVVSFEAHQVMPGFEPTKKVLKEIFSYAVMEKETLSKDRVRAMVMEFNISMSSKILDGVSEEDGVCEEAASAKGSKSLSEAKLNFVRGKSS